jgi:NAD(P)-dependent dehydrogenase (short-subunit alcohol dehydrogenase family)
MDLTYNGKTVIITGAGAGIGREYALEFARRGANVVVNDLGVSKDGQGSDTSAADTVVQEIKDTGGSAVANYDNVATVEGGQAIVKSAVDTFGSVDVLVNNAGILRDKSFSKMSVEDFDAVLNVHLRGAFCVTQPALEVMKKQNFGRIIMTSSTSGLFGNFGQANYGAAKMGLVGFMNVLQIETAKYDIKINAVAPTAASRMTEDIIPPQLQEKLHPKFNVPMVVYLSHESCEENGSIFVMGAGWYGKAAVVCGTGHCIGDAKRDIAAEEIRDNFETISSMEDARPIASTDIFGFMGSLLS